MHTKTELVERIARLRAAARESPVVQLDMPEMNLFAKLEQYNMIGSLKDRSALWVLKAAIERGEVTAETTIIESSSGNFAIALSTFCHLLGISFIPVIDPNISKLNEFILRSTCKAVIKVEERDDTGGFLKTRLAKVKEVCRTTKNSFWTDQYSNHDSMLGHYNLTGGEMCRAFTQLDFVVVPVSTAGTIAGVSRRVKEHFPGVKVIAADSEGSVIFGGKPKKRYLPGVGSSIVPDLLGLAQIDEVIMVPESEAIEGCLELFDRHRLFLGASSGTAYAAVKRCAPRMRGPGKPNVLFLCADRGTAYVDTVYNDAWVSRYITGT